MTRRSNVVKAKHRSRAYFGGCLFCGVMDTDGAHIYPAGPYPQYKEIVFNIVPLCRKHHQMMDNLGGFTRRPAQRINYLETHCMDEYKQQLEGWLVNLKGVLNE